MAKSFSRGIDAARIGACFMVVLLHVAAVELQGFDERWWASNFYDAFSRIAVPVFLMITGVLLLNRQEALSVFFRKRFARIVPPLAFWSLFYLGWYTLQGQDFGGVWGSVRTIINGPVAFHLWYLYAILGISLFVPFMRHIWQGSSRAEQRLYLLIWMAVSAWPLLQTLLGSDVDPLNTYELGTFFGLIGYLFLGVYVHDTLSHRVTTPVYWSLSILLYIFFSLLTMAATWQYSVQQGQPDPLFYDYLSPFVIMASAGMFNLLYGAGVLASRHGALSSQSWSVLNNLALSTLGIYCAHIFILDLLRSHTRLLSSGDSGWWTIPIAAALVFVLSWILVSALRLVRPFRHVL